MSSVNIRKNVELSTVELEPAIFGVDTPERRVAHKIYMARCRLRWSQQDLANFANVFKTVKLSQQRISQIEQGRAAPEFLEVAAMAKAMNCQLVEFDV